MSSGFSSAEEAVIQSFLKGEKIQRDRYKLTAYFGVSAFHDRDLIKKIATGRGERSQCCWDDERKLWGTRSIECVSDLIKTGLWKPEYIVDRRIIDEIGRRAAALAADAANIAEYKKRQEAQKLAKQEEEAERAREAEAGRKAEMVRVAAEKAKIPSTPAEIAEAAALGISAEMLDATLALERLGPAVGLPAMVRIRRWIYHHRHTPVETVVESIKRMVTEKRNPAAESATAPQKSRKTAKTTTAATATTATKKTAAVAAEDDRHRKALGGILAKAATARPIRVAIPLTCSDCGQKPQEQFLECACENNGGWRYCDVCNYICHVTKAPCNCL